MIWEGLGGPESILQNKSLHPRASGIHNIFSTEFIFSGKDSEAANDNLGVCIPNVSFSNLMEYVHTVPLHHFSAVDYKAHHKKTLVNLLSIIDKATDAHSKLKNQISKNSQSSTIFTTCS